MLSSGSANGPPAPSLPPPLPVVVSSNEAASDGTSAAGRKSGGSSMIGGDSKGGASKGGVGAEFTVGQAVLVTRTDTSQSTATVLSYSPSKRLYHVKLDADGRQKLCRTDDLCAAAGPTYGVGAPVEVTRSSGAVASARVVGYTPSTQRYLVRMSDGRKKQCRAVDLKPVAVDLDA